MGTRFLYYEHTHYLKHNLPSLMTHSYCTELRQGPGQEKMGFYAELIILHGKGTGKGFYTHFPGLGPAVPCPCPGSMQCRRAISRSQDTFAFGKACLLGKEVVLVSTTSAINELFASFGLRIVMVSREVRFAGT